MNAPSIAIEGWGGKELRPSLRTRYGLPEDAIASVDEYIQKLIDERGLDPNGPAPFEDESEIPSKK